MRFGSWKPSVGREDTTTEKARAGSCQSGAEKSDERNLFNSPFSRYVRFLDMLLEGKWPWRI